MPCKYRRCVKDRPLYDEKGHRVEILTYLMKGSNHIIHDSLIPTRSPIVTLCADRWAASGQTPVIVLFERHLDMQLFKGNCR